MFVFVHECVVCLRAFVRVRACVRLYVRGLCVFVCTVIAEERVWVHVLVIATQTGRRYRARAVRVTACSRPMRDPVQRCPPEAYVSWWERVCFTWPCKNVT